MSDNDWHGPPHKAVMVLEFTDPEHDVFFRVMDQIRDTLKDSEGIEPTMIHLGIREIADDVLRIFNKPEIHQKAKDTERREAMGLVKHGEGEVLPDSEQQKTAAVSGMTSEAAAELRQENEEADRGDVDNQQ